MYETAVIRLPSNGKLGVPEEVTIRNLTGADEKIIYSGLNESSMDKLIKNCIVDPTDISVSEMCEQDKFYILFQVRILTFGSAYRFETQCQECGAKLEVSIDLDSLPVQYAPDNFDDMLNITLPARKDEIRIKILNSKDIIEVNRLLAKIKKVNDQGTKMILQMASLIDRVNDKEMKSLIERQKYVESLSSRDIAFIWRKVGALPLGLIQKALADCPVCGKTSEVSVVMNTEFFRPTFVDEEIDD